MANPRRCAQSTRHLLQPLLRQHSRGTTIPTFLAPAFAQASKFSSSSTQYSKVGSAVLSLPPEVKFTILEPSAVKQAQNAISRKPQGPTVEIEGPLGKLSLTIPPYMSIDVNEESRTRQLQVLDKNDREQRTMWGTMRAHLNNHILGVSEGHTAILRLVGVGYRATIEENATTVSPTYLGQKFVSLKVGYSHPIELGIPKGVQASTPQPTRILLEGVEKEVVMQFAAEIRAWRKPEPYKGKGIFVNGETIRLKAKKIK